jgi:CheY-like chemotaxis protein
MKTRSLTALLIALLVFTLSAQPPGAAARPVAPDVLVVGGTPAGVAAAVAAARCGQSVELVAKGRHLGGVLTDAMMDQWDLNLAGDGKAIEGGIFAEIYARLGDSFTPDQAAAAFDDLVAAEPRIQLVTQAAPIAVHVDVSDTRRITSVLFRTAGMNREFSVEARYVIDASDDGDVAALAGARFDLGRQDTGRDDRMQPVTLMFSLTGVDWDRLTAAYSTVRDGFGGATERRAWGYAKVLSAYRPSQPNVVVADLNLGHESTGGVTVNAIDVLGIDGCDYADLARARSIAEREAPRLVAWLRGRIPGLESAQIGRYADTIYVRETRHFAGLERLTADGIWDGRIPDDSIGLSSYPLDLHPVTLDDKPAFAPIRHVYGVPFGSLVPLGFSNMILASPAISASHLASGSARVIPTTIEEGEAAGNAAAIATKTRTDFETLARTHADIAELRTQLAGAGVILMPSPVEVSAITAESRSRSWPTQEPEK